MSIWFLGWKFNAMKIVGDEDFSAVNYFLVLNKKPLQITPSSREVRPGDFSVYLSFSL